MRPDKRTRLIEAAAKLVYERGFANTALSDIAREAEVPLGNIYYYFKTKAEIGEAIVAQQLAAFEDQRLAGRTDRPGAHAAPGGGARCRSG